MEVFWMMMILKIEKKYCFFFFRFLNMNLKICNSTLILTNVKWELHIFIYACV